MPEWAGAAVQLLAVLGLLIELAGLASAGHAVLHGRSPQGSIAWALALVLFPPLSLPLYWIFGRWKYEGYVVSRRLGQDRIHEVRESLHEATESWRDDGGPRAALWRELEALGGLRPTRGNTARLLIDARETYEDLFAGLAEAERYVLVQVYALDDGELGGELLERLKERAQAGIEVRLLVDAIGSWELPDAAFEPLKAAGGKVATFEARGKATGRMQLNFRNHRKVAVVDGRVGWVGGLNAEQVCLGGDERLGSWRDTHLRLTGPAALGLQLGFLEDWSWATEDVPDLEWTPRGSSEAKAGVCVLQAGPADELDTWSLGAASAFASAERRLWIATPYFLPDERVSGAMQLAALRGVDVRLLLPSVNDHRIVHLASLSQLGEIGTTGVAVYRYGPGFTHQKVALIDDDLSVISTGNLDARSLRLAFETAAFVRDASLAADLEQALERDFALSERQPADPLAQRSLATRVAARVARLFSPVL